MAVNLAYNVTGAKMFFPPQAGSSSGNVVPADSSTSTVSTIEITAPYTSTSQT